MITKHRNVSIIIFYDDLGNILVQDRSEKENRRIPVDFGFFGGGIEGNETGEEAIVREVNEELSIQLKNFRFFKKYHQESEEFGINADISVFTAIMPELREIKVTEGKAILMKIGDFYKKKTMEWDKEILEEVEVYLKI